MVWAPNTTCHFKSSINQPLLGCCSTTRVGTTAKQLKKCQLFHRSQMEMRLCQECNSWSKFDAYTCFLRGKRQSGPHMNYSQFSPDCAAGAAVSLGNTSDTRLYPGSGVGRLALTGLIGKTYSLNSHHPLIEQQSVVIWDPTNGLLIFLTSFGQFGCPTGRRFYVLFYKII